MKKTVTVNLGGVVYQIDEDAFHLLDEYLKNIRLHFRKEKGVDDMMSDMESRIADLFAEKLNEEKKVVVVEDVEEVIARMGKPEQIASEDSEYRDEASADTQQTKTTGTSHKTLYRDIDNKMIGGVAAGMAANLGYDVTWVRLFMVLLILIPVLRGAFLLIYIIAWIFIPPAKTAAEKLNMHGKDVTVENIGKTVTEGFNKVRDSADDYINSGKPQSTAKKISEGIVAVAAFLFKILLVILLILCVPLLAIIFAVLAVILAASCGALFGMGSGLLDFISFGFDPKHVSIWLDVFGSIAGLILIGVPLVALAYSICRQFFHWKPMPKGWKITLSVLWVISLIAGIIFAILFLSAYSI